LAVIEHYQPLAIDVPIMPHCRRCETVRVPVHSVGASCCA
jgi:hypothetical protein